MKVKQSHSDLDERPYIGKVLAVMGVIAFGLSLTVAWPALSYIVEKLIS
ncbi:MAG: hypothetical protein Tsb0017_25230 [Geothermobacteraceae bacterium]